MTVKGDNWQIGKHWPGDKKKGAFVYEAKRLIGRDPSEKTLLKDTERLPCFELVSNDWPHISSLDELLETLQAFSTGDNDALCQSSYGQAVLAFLANVTHTEDEVDDEFWQLRAQAVLRDNPVVRIQHFFQLRPVFVHMDAVIELEEISALLLRHCKRQVETRQAKLMTDCTITVPAHFADSQRLATIDAARIAGWKNVQLVNEPTAAAVAQIFDKNLDDGCYLLPDLGGGTFDISILSVLTDESGQKVFVVKATGGDNLLGGANFTEALMDIAKRRGASLGEEELRAVCEQAKMELSISHEAVFEIDIAEDAISREDFRVACSELLDKVSSTVAQTLSSSGVSISDIRAVIMAGGASETFGFRDAIAAVVGGVEIINPLRPSHLCARGAAFIASGKALVTEVLSRSIGIEVDDGSLSIIMHRASPLPLEGDRTYYPTSLEKPSRITLYEGEEKMADENLLLGEFEVSGFKSLDDEFQVHIQVNEAREVEVRAVVSGDTQAELKVHRSQKFARDQISTMASICSRRCPIPTITNKLLEEGQRKRAASSDEEQSKRLKMTDG